MRKIQKSYKASKGHNTMKTETLLRIYRQFQDNPLKTFVKRDLSSGTMNVNPYLHALVGLGLIEQVDIFYRSGKGYKSHSRIYGFRKKYQYTITRQ